MRYGTGDGGEVILKDFSVKLVKRGGEPNFFLFKMV